MIVFNGTALEQVAPVKIVDIRVSPIPMTAQARQRPVEWGADFVRLTGGSRTVAIEFALLTDDMEVRQSQLAAIARWAHSNGIGKLMIPNRRNMYLECICTSLPEPSLRQWWESKLRLVFTTYDNPYWTSVGEKSIACGTAFVALGDAPPLMRIERTLEEAATDQEYSNGTETMSFTTMPVGDVVIDLTNQTATVTSGTPPVTASIMQYYGFESEFIIPRTGTQTITGTGTVKWRERWL